MFPYDVLETRGVAPAREPPQQEAMASRWRFHQENATFRGFEQGTGALEPL